MKDRSPAMQFYFRQFAADEVVTLMDLDAVGAHILLMCAAGASIQRYKFPYDRHKLSKIFRVPSEQDFDRIMGQLLDGAWKVSEDGQWLVQEGMMRTLRKQKEFSKSQSEKASKRWHAGSMPDSMPNACRNDAQPMPSSASTPASTIASIDINTNTKRRRSAPSGSLPVSIENYPVPEIFGEAGKQAVVEWITHRAQLKKPLTATSLQRLYVEYRDKPDELGIDIGASIKNGWQGLFSQSQKNGGLKPIKRPAITDPEMIPRPYPDENSPIRLSKVQVDALLLKHGEQSLLEKVSSYRLWLQDGGPATLSHHAQESHYLNVDGWTPRTPNPSLQGAEI